MVLGERRGRLDFEHMPVKFLRFVIYPLHAFYLIIPSSHPPSLNQLLHYHYTNHKINTPSHHANTNVITIKNASYTLYHASSTVSDLRKIFAAFYET